MKPVTLTGKVTKFHGNGRQLGYPTANITTVTELAEGIYFGFADLATFTARPALIFIGTPITIGDTEPRVEVHVLDIPDVDYYGQMLSIVIRQFHRPNQHFASSQELIAAMHDDEKQARDWFIKNPLAKPGHLSDT
jgi:riboflavin kinase/FMN adenylyltransferase